MSYRFFGLSMVRQVDSGRPPAVVAKSGVMFLEFRSQGRAANSAKPTDSIDHN